MAAVELSAGSPDLRLGCCRRVQQSAQSLGGAGGGREPVVGPDLRGGAGGGLAAGTDEHPFPEPRCDQWCGDSHACGQQAQGVVLPAPLSGGWVWGPMSSWAALKRPETAENTQTAMASASVGRPAMAAARASRALETSASSRETARARANPR